MGCWCSFELVAFACRSALSLLVHPPTASDIDKLSSHPMSLLRSQPQNYIRDILRPANTSQWGRRSNGGLLFRRDVPGLDGSWRDDVHGDSVLSQLGCSGTAVRLVGVLVRGIAHVGDVSMGRVSTHVDDAAPSGATPEKSARVLRHHQHIARLFTSQISWAAVR